MNYPKVSIIILNWNNWRDTIECLESVYQIAYSNYDVIVVDNGSEDGSINTIEDYAKGKIIVESPFFKFSSENKPIQVIKYTRQELEAEGGKKKDLKDLATNRKIFIIRNEKNDGFAKANNVAIKYVLKDSDPDYVLLLNNDTVVDKSFLNDLVGVAESDPTIGVASPKVYFYSEPRKIQFARTRLELNRGRTIPIGGGETDSGRHENIQDTDFCTGSCMLIKREVLQKIGLLDTGYFAYWEDTDYCQRAKVGGFRVVYGPPAKIWHKGSSSGRKISGFVEYYLARNRFRFIKKYANKGQFVSFLFYFFLWDFWFRSGIYLLYHRNVTAQWNFLKGVREGIKACFKE